MGHEGRGYREHNGVSEGDLQEERRRGLPEVGPREQAQASR